VELALFYNSWLSIEPTCTPLENPHPPSQFLPLSLRLRSLERFCSPVSKTHSNSRPCSALFRYRNSSTARAEETIRRLAKTAASSSRVFDRLSRSLKDLLHIMERVRDADARFQSITLRQSIPQPLRAAWSCRCSGASPNSNARWSVNERGRPGGRAGSRCEGWTTRQIEPSPAARGDSDSTRRLQDSG
jgi:hypothetical protein